MDIYAQPGTKVIFLNQNGTDYDLQNAREHFKEGDVLTVAKTEVGSWSTSVYFKEVPGVGFNSVMFQEAV